MKHTWNNIEEQMQSAQNEVNRILNSTTEEDLKPTGLKAHRTAIGMAAFGLALLVISFILPSSPSSYQAEQKPMSKLLKGDLISESTNDSLNPFAATTDNADTTSVSDEAEEIDVVPLSKPAETEPINPFATPATTETKTEPVNPFATPATTETKTEPVNPFATPATTETKTEPVNPFATPATTETKTEPVNPFATPATTELETEPVNPFLKEPVPTDPEVLHGTAENSDAGFKENTHTYDTVAATLPVNDGVVADPLGEVSTNSESFHEASRIVEQNLTGTASKGGVLYTGILKSGGVNSNPRIKYPFTYQLLLDDNSQVKIDTQRDLRNVIGKEITIEIEGTKDKFVLQHVYYNPQKQLPQSGPELMLLITGLFALFLAKVTYRRG